MVCLCSILKTLFLTSAITPPSEWNTSNLKNAFLTSLTPQIEWNTFANNSAVRCAFSGNDLTNSLTKPEDCGKVCAKTPDCTHYTWTDFNSGTCWMKKNRVSKSDAFVKQDQNAVCGIIADTESLTHPRIRWNERNTAQSCAFDGNDLTNALSKSEDCRDLCASTEGCTHFTWTDFNSGTCWMKGNTVTKSDALHKTDQNAHCGIVDGSYASERTSISETVDPSQSNFYSEPTPFPNLNSLVDPSQSTSDSEPTPFPSLNSFERWESFPKWMSEPELNSTELSAVSESGHSTRYWDCCKPSCSWNGKASVTNPVNACSKDGFQVLTDRNAQSGCGGGNAFTCNNNIPWALNDNLSYGFAAAHVKGKKEADLCCKCYQLTFTSGPVHGKKMIVQVTNTGDDLGENHFDLQIPGGGVGIFNGCTSQWGAPDGGWGDRYGGVHSIQECDQLPSQIRQGCKWRFQWFQGADNPSFDFVEVGCPQELTSKTGCSRR